MNQDPRPKFPTDDKWSLFTNHGFVLLCIAVNSEIRLREIADRVGITERSAHAIVRDLQTGGFIEKAKLGRRNSYSILRDRRLNHDLVTQCSIGTLITALSV